MFRTGIKLLLENTRYELEISGEDLRTTLESYVYTMRVHAVDAKNYMEGTDKDYSRFSFDWLDPVTGKSITPKF